MKRLAWLSVEDYAATQMELVVVSAMKGYLRRMPEKEAFKKVEAILAPKVIRLAGDDGAPMPIQSNVDGAKLAAFIDAAVADSIRELEKKMTCQSWCDHAGKRGWQEHGGADESPVFGIRAGCVSGFEIHTMTNKNCWKVHR
ncbi:MAG: hypothetical protein ACLUIO_19990 [Neglectibacter timonensis]